MAPETLPVGSESRSHWKKWAIAEGYIPPYSHGPSPQMVSHEAIYILNSGEEEAHVDVTIYYEDRDPVGPYRFTIEGTP